MSEFFKCACGAEVIQVERNIEIIDRKKDVWNAQVYFAMFHYGTQNPRPILREKLRHCWRILKTGKNYADNVIMNITEAREMGAHLLRITDETGLKKDAEKMLREWKNTKLKREEK